MVGHHPPRSNGHHGNNSELMQHLEPLLLRYGVQVRACPAKRGWGWRPAGNVLCRSACRQHFSNPQTPNRPGLPACLPAAACLLRLLLPACLAACLLLQAYFSGHDHNLEHLQPDGYNIIVTGGCSCTIVVAPVGGRVGGRCSSGGRHMPRD